LIDDIFVSFIFLFLAAESFDESSDPNS